MRFLLVFFYNTGGITKMFLEFRILTITMINLKFFLVLKKNKRVDN